MEQKKIYSRLTLTLLITGFHLFGSSNGYAGEPSSKNMKEKTESPKKENVTYCVVKGFYQEIKEENITYYVCRLVSEAKCVAIPCKVWSPYGPKDRPAVIQEIAPTNVSLPENGNYIVKFENNIPTTVQIVNDISLVETGSTIEIHYN